MTLWIVFISEIVFISQSMEDRLMFNIVMEGGCIYKLMIFITTEHFLEANQVNTRFYLKVRPIVLILNNYILQIAIICV